MLSIEKRLKNLHGSLIRRCYDKGTLKKNPNYNGCVVSEDFLDYEKFKDNIKNVRNYEVWETSEGWHLDKDEFGSGKIYSISSCCFLPKKINITIQSGGQKKYSSLPNGVVEGKGKKNKTYTAQCYCDKPNTRYIGSFNTVRDAFDAYSSTKKRLIAKLTCDFFVLLDDETIDKLLEYEPAYDYGNYGVEY